MNSYDPQKAARVWQRVQEAPPAENYPALVQEAVAAGGAYQQLARQLPEHRSRLQHLLRESGSTAQALRGICILATGNAPALQPLPPPRERPEILLRKSYARAVRQAQAFQRLSDAGEYAPVFRQLADREHQACTALAEIIGRGK